LVPKVALFALAFKRVASARPLSMGSERQPHHFLGKRVRAARTHAGTRLLFAGEHLKAKQMITQDEAKRRILGEFRSWARDQDKSTPNGTDGLIFFGHLQQERPELLAFRYGGDKWQIVHGWLRGARLVSN
jgi:hypothetical protein